MASKSKSFTERKLPMMLVQRTQGNYLAVRKLKIWPAGIRRVLVLLIWASHSLHAQSSFRVDSLPSDGLILRSGWRWHSGDNRAWASPNLNDQRWDTLRPTRNIVKETSFRKTPQGWLRLHFILDSVVARQPMAFAINQIGASELYIDGVLFQRLGKVGRTYQQQQGYIPTAGDVYLLPKLLAGKHLLAVRLSQHRPPWYAPKYFYLNQSIFEATLFPAVRLTRLITDQVYLQTLGNYLLVGLFGMLGAIHFMYYRYRRKRVNFVFGLTLLLGTLSVVLIEQVGLITNSAVNEWIWLVHGMLIALFMLFLLVTFYVYLQQPVTWILVVIGVLLLIPRTLSAFAESSWLTSIISIVSIVALFADGIRICIAAIRARQANARFMLSSILVMVLILLIGSAVSWWLSVQYPAYGMYAPSIINVLFFLTLPISFAIILAREHAQTNRSLEDRLVEVDQLSREKEGILTRQNETLEQQVAERTAQLTQSLTELRETQQQLVQREKMAGLGELTAGIAHEIQNPLNFVNNFAEVSGELVEELKQEQMKDKRDQELELEILDDLAQNLLKINHHGGRAASIIRGMLDHSRSHAGQREPTDLNALVDEYLRLSYHGLRAKNTTIDIYLLTELDPAVGNPVMVAQDIGRVLLNLFNNAFYAVLERQHTAPAGYKPTVTVRTKRMNKVVEIRINDNGSGVEESIREKIFQPFFTTKPTGQGTGLGLSLSYDIITKGHNGQFLLETIRNDGTTFLIQLPASVS